MKGLPPTIVAPVINILNIVDQEITLSGMDFSKELEEELLRLKNSIVLMNYNPADDKDEDDVITSIELEEELGDNSTSDLNIYRPNDEDDEDLSWLND